MMIQGIPPSQIVKTAARRNKDYEVEFANTDSNSDIYTLKIFLRKSEGQYKVRLVLISSILAYPAFEMSWVFDDEEYELASRVFHRVCDEADVVKEDYSQSMTPGSTIAAKIREAVKPISLSHQEEMHNLPLDEAKRLAGVSDWRQSIYSNRYPNMTTEDKQKIQKFEGNETEQPLERKDYPTRGSY